MDVHDRQTRHHERAQRTNVDGRIYSFENTNDQFLKLDVADHDLRVARASDHSRIALVKRNRLYSFVHLLNVTTHLLDAPVRETVEPVGEATMGFGISDVIKTL